MSRFNSRVCPPQPPPPPPPRRRPSPRSLIFTPYPPRRPAYPLPCCVPASLCSRDHRHICLLHNLHRIHNLHRAMDFELDLLILRTDSDEDDDDELPRRRGPSVFNRRSDPSEALSDTEFKTHFRHSKETIGTLVNLLRTDLQFPNDRGRPLSPMQQVCVALNTFAGAPFQRTAGLCGGVSQGAAWNAIFRVTLALCRRKPQFIRMPNEAEMEETAERMYDQFHLPNFAFGVDGMQCCFEEAPRGLSPGQQYDSSFTR